MEEKQFKSVSVRTVFLDQIRKFIDDHPDFVAKNPEYNSVAGFVTEATRLRLQELAKARDFELEGDLRDLESHVQKMADPAKRARAEAAFVEICSLFGVKKEEVSV
jgi:hypothetical protein